MFIRSLLLILVVVTGIHLSAQEDSLSVDPAGKYDRIFLQTGEFGSHFNFEYQHYLVDQDALADLEKHIYKYQISIVLGTWCHDSQEQVPRFIKILDKLNYNTRNLEIICVDRDKLAGEINIESLDIQRVPTFIFYKEAKEAGRIIETPFNSLEKDILTIIED